MKMSIAKAALEPLTSTAQRIAGKEGRDVVKLDAACGSLTIEASDGAVFYRATVEGDVEAAGEVRVSGAALGKLVSRLPDERVMLALPEGRSLRLTCHRVRSSLKIEASEWRATAPSVVEDQALLVSAADLAAAMRFVQSTISSGVRYGLDGVFLEIEQAADGPRLRCVSTNGHCLRYQQIPVTVEGGCATPSRGLIHRDTVAQMRSFLESRSGAVRLRFNSRGRAMSVSDEGARLTLTLADGEFPDYRRVLSGLRSTGEITFEGRALDTALRRASVALDAGTRSMVTLNRVQEGAAIEIRCSSFNAISEHAETVPVTMTWQAKSGPIGLGRQFLAQLVRDLGSPEAMTLWLGEPLEPVQYKQDDDGRLAVIMPIRVD